MTDNEEKLITGLTDRISSLESKLDMVLSLLGSSSFSSQNQKSCDYNFGEWLLHWQKTYKRSKQNDETYNRNLKRITDDIIPALGDIKLSELTTDAIQDYINALPVSNTRDKISFIFSGSLKKAFDLGYTERNLFKAVETVKNISESYSVLQPKTQLKLFKIIKMPKYLRMFFFYCCTGFRFSEGLSINPQTDIDRKRKVIILRMSDKNTKKHRREVPYLPELFQDFDLSQTSLFPDITKNGAKLYFSKLFKKHKIDAVFHSFRHTFISCCYHIGIPEKYIQSWVGHSSIVTTMDTYTHILNYVDTPIFDYLKRLKRHLKIT